MLELILVALVADIFIGFNQVCLRMGFDCFLYGKDALLKEVLLLLCQLRTQDPLRINLIVKILEFLDRLFVQIQEGTQSQIEVEILAKLVEVLLFLLFFRLHG